MNKIFQCAQKVVHAPLEYQRPRGYAKMWSFVGDNIGPCDLELMIMQGTFVRDNDDSVFPLAIMNPIMNE